MSAEVEATIATELAALVQIADFPTAPFGYGSDISGALDLDPSMAETEGFATLTLAQSIVRRLDTPRGTLPDDKNWGISISSYLNFGSTDQDIRQIAGQIRSELTLDDRIDSLTVRVAPSSTGSTLSIGIQVQPLAADAGPFTLTLSASDAGLILEEIEAAI